MFLAMGSSPVMFNKLQHAGDWDNQIGELTRLAEWTGRQTEGHLNWQVVNLKARAEDLSDSRILYIAGKKPLKFDKDELDKLRRFVELGGLLVFHADDSSKAFETSAAGVLRDLWPELELRAVR